MSQPELLQSLLWGSPSSILEQKNIWRWSRAVLSASGTTLVDIKVEDTLLGFGGGMSRGLSATSAALTARVKDLESALIIRNEWLIERNILNAELAAEKIKSNKPTFAIIRQQTLIYFD